MKTYTKTQLAEIVLEHGLWLGGGGGIRADFSGADLSWANLDRVNLSRANLSRADLSRANLSEAVGNNNKIKTIQSGLYLITYTSETMWIGCKSASIADWFSFTDDQIIALDPSLAEESIPWWHKWKPISLSRFSN